MNEASVGAAEHLISFPQDDADGDVAIRIYYAHHRGRLFKMVQRRYPTLPDDLVANAVNDAFRDLRSLISMERKTPYDENTYLAPSPFRLLCAIACRRACDEYRSHTKSGKFRQDEREPEELIAAMQSDDHSINPASHADMSDLQQALLDAFDSMPYRQRRLAQIMAECADFNLTPKSLQRVARERGIRLTQAAAKKALETIRAKISRILVRFSTELE